MKGVLYLERQKAQIFLADRENILVFNFTPAFIDNLEVTHSEELEKQLIGFLQANAVPPAELMFVLSSSVMFQQDFTKEQEIAIQPYIDTIPFENVSFKTVTTPTGTRLFTTNTDLYGCIKEILEKKGFIVVAVIPEMALGAPIAGFNASVGRLILTQEENLKLYTFFENKPAEDIPVQSHPVEKKKPEKNSSLKILLPIFVILIGILIFVVIRSMHP